MVKKETLHIGFFGTREGLSEHQKSTFHYFFLRIRRDVHFHHGDGLGADYSAHAIALRRGSTVIIHPPLDTRQRAFASGAFSVLPAKGTTERTLDIIRASDYVFAAPAGERKDMPQSETWTAISLAIREKTPVTVIYPNGGYEDYFPWEPV